MNKTDFKVSEKHIGFSTCQTDDEEVITSVEYNNKITKNLNLGNKATIETREETERKVIDVSDNNISSTLIKKNKKGKSKVSIKNQDVDVKDNNTVLNMSVDPTNINNKTNSEESFHYILDDKISVVFLVYAPGTNKDDALFPAFQKRDFMKISTGELLKKHFSDLITAKKEIGGDIVVNLIQEFIEANKERCTRYLICGFPRSEDNSSSWKKIIGKKYSVTALIYISYSRKEHENELAERAKRDNKSINYNEIGKVFDYFIKNTAQVFDDFGEKKLIKVSAKIPDETIISTIMKNELISKKYQIHDF